ncbi:MAG: penicillin-binding protein 2 [Magnetococcus sp. WYHC-3]
MIQNDQEGFVVDARRRLLVLGGGAGLLLATIAGRLFHLQVLKGGTYRDMAENNRISLQPIPAPRGRILDRFQRVLVENNPDYRMGVIPELAGDLEAVLTRLGDFLNLEEEEIAALLRQGRRQRGFLPLTVKSHLEWEELCRIEAHIHQFPGALIQIQSRRHYPNKTLASHILGYLGEVNENDRTIHAGIRFRSGDLVGKSGMERLFETHLRGREGVREVEVNAVGRQVRELRSRPPTSGRDLMLTLDLDLQQVAETALAGQSGAVVALDPTSGEVLAMASQPAFNPNQFIRGFSSKEWRQLVSDEGRPLNNKAIQGQYPPGSTFKVVVALAALRLGKLDPRETFFCPGYVELDDHRFFCWKRWGHGRVNLTQALAQSCDVFFYRLAERIGITPIEEMARELGLGTRTGLGLAGEQEGLVPSKAWKRAQMGTVWYPGETLITAIGQGYLLTTPLQLARLAAVIANGGIVHQPTLVRESEGFRPVVKSHVDLPMEFFDLVRHGMNQVYEGEQGTARRSRPTHVRAAAKTGTVQVVRHQRNEDGSVIDPVDWKLRDHGLFICHAPLDNPRLALSVVVEHGGSGSQAAAPVAMAILDAYFQPGGPQRRQGAS